MNAQLSSLHALDHRRKAHADAYYVEHLPGGMKLIFGYRITQQGVPNSRYFGPNNPDADGVPTEVRLTDCTVYVGNGVEIAKPLADFSQEYREQIQAAAEEREDELLY